MFGISIGDFRSGSFRELEEELREKDRKIEEYEKLLADLAKLKEESRDYFDMLRSERKAMDKSLTGVVDYVHEGGELSSAGNLTADEIEKGLKKLSDDVKEARDPLSEVPRLRDELAAASAELDGMEDFFRNISVTCLTAAIEAGRLGESAGKFVKIAEDIRIESEKREHGMTALSDAVRELSIRVDALSAVSLPDADRINVLKEKTEALKYDLAEIFKKQNSILDEMETLGKNFIEEREASERAEEQFGESIGKISFSACSQTQADGAEPTIQGE